MTSMQEKKKKSTIDLFTKSPRKTLEKSILLKWPKAVYRFKTIPIKKKKKMVFCTKQRNLKVEAGATSRCWSRKVWNSPPSTNTENIYWHMEQCLWKTHWRLRERLPYNQAVRKIHMEPGRKVREVIRSGSRGLQRHRFSLYGTGTKSHIDQWNRYKSIP